MFLQLSYVGENGKFTTTLQKAVIMAYSSIFFSPSGLIQVCISNLFIILIRLCEICTWVHVISHLLFSFFLLFLAFE